MPTTVYVRDAAGTPQPYTEVSGVQLATTEETANGDVATFIYEKDIPKELPDISPDDNGRFLGVVDNEWRIVDAPESESCLPELSQEDEGKILGVSNGEWAMLEMPEAGNGNSCLPEILPEDEGKILGIVDGKWDKVEAPTGGNGQGEVTDVPVTISWDTSVPPTTTVNIPELGFIAYKISDATPTKEQVLSANWKLVDHTGVAYEFQISQEDIAVEEDFGIDVFLTFDPEYAYAVIYQTGTHQASYMDVTFNLDVKETGIYQFWTAGGAFPTNLTGSIAYIDQQIDIGQSDWNQNDSTKPDYIKNRPFHDGASEFKLLMPFEITRLEYLSGSGLYGSDEYVPVEYIQEIPSIQEMLDLWDSDWNRAHVTFGDETYICEPITFGGVKFVGNVDAATGGGEGNGLPFVFGMGISDNTLVMTAASLEDKATVILQQQNIAFTKMETTSYGIVEVAAIPIISGETYCVVRNGSSHVLTANSVNIGSVPAVYLGNPYLSDGSLTDSGDSFFIGTFTTDGTDTTVIIDRDISNGETPYEIVQPAYVEKGIGISLEYSAVKTIDDKYIGPISWSKISEKPFGTIPSGTVVVDETIVVGSFGEDDGSYYSLLNTLNSDLVVDGAEYTATFLGETITGIGGVNDDFRGIVIEYDGMEVGVILCDFPAKGSNIFAVNRNVISAGTTINFKATLASDIIKKIDPAYLPDDIGGGTSLPESTSSDNGKVLTVGTDGIAAWSDISHPTELPVVSGSNEGQVLGVSDGVWKPIDPPESSSTSLPEVTSKDAGKFLRVGSDGSWIVEAIPSAEGASF